MLLALRPSPMGSTCNTLSALFRLSHVLQTTSPYITLGAPSAPSAALRLILGQQCLQLAA